MDTATTATPDYCDTCNGPCWGDHAPDDAEPEPQPGDQLMLYINAYEVTRHYGGSEEGGWWYNAGEPLASIPMRGHYVATSDGGYDRVEPKPIDGAQAEAFETHLAELFGDVAHGNIYSVLGGAELSIVVETAPAAYWPATRPHYE